MYVFKPIKLNGSFATFVCASIYKTLPYSFHHQDIFDVPKELLVSKSVIEEKVVLTSKRASARFH